MTYYNKINFHKKQNNNIKINKYLNKLGIKQIKFIKNTSEFLGGAYESINFNKRSQIFTVKNNPSNVYNLINEEELSSGSYGVVNMYDLVLDGNELMTVVTKEFDDFESYLIEKDIYFRFKIKHIDTELNSKLLFYSDDHKLLIFEYLGETLNTININKIPFVKRLKMVVDILSENLNLMLSNFIHNDIKTTNIAYNKQTEKISMLDYGLTIDLHIDNMDIIDTNYGGLSNYYLEIYHLINLRKQHLSSRSTHEMNVKFYNDYKDISFKSQLYSLGILCACILVGNFEYINLINLEDYFGTEVFEPLIDRFRGFTKPNCKEYINDIANDMLIKLLKINIDKMKFSVIRNLIRYLCNLGYWHEFDYSAEYEDYDIGTIDTHPNNNLMVLSNLIRKIKSIIHDYK